MKKFLVMVGVVVLSLMGCQPFNKPEFVDIAPNETAFVVPLTGETSDQAKFMSVEFLEKNMVATKRIQITKEWIKDGRGPGNGHYAPTIKVIKVDRTPVSAMWINGSGDKKIEVESIESIGFSVGISLTAMIDATDAPKFLYKYAGVPLKTVVDTDVNSYVKSRCSSYFGVLALEEGKKQKQNIIDKVLKETQTFFSPYGITISQLGFTEGLTYDQKEIQDSIDSLASKQAAIKVQTAELERQRIQNTNDSEIAQTARDIAYNNAKKEADAKQYAAAATAANLNVILKQRELDVAMANAEARKVLAANPNFRFPNVVSEKTLTVMGMDKLMGDGGDVTK